MNELQKYPVAVSMLNGAKDEVGFNYVYLAHEVDARIAQIEAVNAAHLARHVELTRQLASELQTTQKLQMEVNLHKRAVEWLAGQVEFEDDGEFGKVEVPAEFAEIIKPRES